MYSACAILPASISLSQTSQVLFSNLALLICEVWSFLSIRASVCFPNFWVFLTALITDFAGCPSLFVESTGWVILLRRSTEFAGGLSFSYITLGGYPSQMLHWEVFLLSPSVSPREQLTLLAATGCITEAGVHCDLASSGLRYVLQCDTRIHVAR